MPRPADHRTLLRTEAEARARLLQIEHTAVDLDLTGDGPSFPCTTTLTFACNTPGAETFVDFKGTELRGAELNGQPVDRSGWEQGRLTLRDLQASNTLVVAGTMAYSSDGEGLHRHVDPADQQVYLYAMSFLDAAPRWFACFDQPDLKSTYELTVAAPDHWTVIGNGPARKVGPRRWRIASDRPLSTYYVTLVAGPYASVYAEHDGIPLGFHVRESLGEHLQAEADDLIEVTRQCLDYYHRTFAIRYPFGEYHQAFVPDFNAGAMENPGCVTFRDSYIFRARATATERAGRACTVAHEMAHMWFGDVVTMRWWDDLWLNESFAEYMAHRACAEATRYSLWTQFGVVRKDWGAIVDQSPSTHPVAGNGAIDTASSLQNFDGISYAKGAALLQQLVAYVGDDVFFEGVNTHFDQHAFANAEFADLLAAWTAAGAIDLDRWAADWLLTSGMDRIDVERSPGAVTIIKTPPAGATVERTHALQVAALDNTGALLSSTAVRLTTEPARVVVSPAAAVIVPDAGDETWARIRFGEDAWEAVRHALPGLVDSASVVVIYNGLRDAVRDAEIDPRVALDLVCTTIGTSNDDVMIEAMLQFAQFQLAGSYASPPERADRLSRVHTTALAITESSDPGSDRQLEAFRLTVKSSADAAGLRGWLESRDLPDALTIDRELAWTVIERLACLDPDPSAIDVALVRDQSASALEHAARARSSLPAAAAKDAAWQLLMKPSGISAYEVYATAAGFFDAGQTALTEPYLERFFAEIPDTADFRTGWVLGQVAAQAYPVMASTAEPLELAERTLARADLAAPIRRSLVDGTDQLRRAVRSRRIFGQ